MLGWKANWNWSRSRTAGSLEERGLKPAVAVWPDLSVEQLSVASDTVDRLHVPDTLLNSYFECTSGISG